MPFNGSGTFNRLYSWVVDAANNVNISSSRMDGELNGIAAALTNCLTRDGQSPPSVDIPWGAKRITNLGAPSAGTDALNRDTADARYVLASGATNLTLLGALNAATGAFSGNVTVGGTLVTTGMFTANGNARINGSGSSTAIVVDDHTNASGVNIQLNGNGGTTPNKTLRVINGAFQITNSAYSSVLFALDDSGNATLGGTVTTTTASPGDNSTKAATTAFVTAAITAAAGAPLNSPAFTGTPTAPTAAAGTATTQLATTAFVDGMRDVPSNAKTANYALALTDRGGGVDFNGTSLTCTIPANASVAFPVGTVILLTNLNSTALSIAITSDTLTLAGTVTTGTRTLSQNGVATLRKVGSISWIISGSGLS